MSFFPAQVRSAEPGRAGPLLAGARDVLCIFDPQPNGCGSNLNRGYAGVGPGFHLPGQAILVPVFAHWVSRIKPRKVGHFLFSRKQPSLRLKWGPQRRQPPLGFSLPQGCTFGCSCFCLCCVCVFLSGGRRGDKFDPPFANNCNCALLEDCFPLQFCRGWAGGVVLFSLNRTRQPMGNMFQSHIKQSPLGAKQVSFSKLMLVRLWVATWGDGAFVDPKCGWCPENRVEKPDLATRRSVVVFCFS